jgi:hypothetical protein
MLSDVSIFLETPQPDVQIPGPAGAVPPTLECAPLALRWLIALLVWVERYLSRFGRTRDVFPLLVVILAVPRMFGRWQVGPVLFTPQRFPRRFALRPRQKHSEQVVAAIYCVEAGFRFR